MTISIPDAVQGGTHTQRSFTWTRADGTAQDLTGATLTGTKKNLRTGEVTTLATGSLNVLSASGGTFTWDLDAADLADAGFFEVQIIATYGAGDVEVSLAGEWKIYPKNS